LIPPPSPRNNRALAGARAKPAYVPGKAYTTSPVAPAAPIAILPKIKGIRMTIHIGAKPGDIAETVLLPGDPYRAKWAAETFLENPVCVNQVRGMLGFTGTWQGHRVTIQGSGMGMPSLSIYVNELIRDFGAKTLIRIGSAGAMVQHVNIHDVVLAMTASTISTPSRTILREVNYAPVADWSLLKAAADYAAAKGTTTHVGGIYSSDTFYDERPDLTEQMTRHGVRSLAVLTISDHLLTGEALPPQDRERSFGDMVDIALHAAFD